MAVTHLEVTHEPSISSESGVYIINCKLLILMLNDMVKN